MLEALRENIKCLGKLFVAAGCPPKHKYYQMFWARESPGPIHSFQVNVRYFFHPYLMFSFRIYYKGETGKGEFKLPCCRRQFPLA